MAGAKGRCRKDECGGERCSVTRECPEEILSESEWSTEVTDGTERGEETRGEETSSSLGDRGFHSLNSPCLP